MNQSHMYNDHPNNATVENTSEKGHKMMVPEWNETEEGSRILHEWLQVYEMYL